MNIEETKTVLIVEDTRWVAMMMCNAIERLGCKVVIAWNEANAREYFADYVFDCIVMDACLGTAKPNTIDLVKEFRLSFDGPMIAASSASTFSKQLMSAGRDHMCGKVDVPKKVVELLGLQKS